MSITEDLENENLLSNFSYENSFLVSFSPIWLIKNLLIKLDKYNIKKNDAKIAKYLNSTFSNDIENLKVIYGGSVNVQNCSKIFELDTVHGALIGGSSLKFKDFLAIYKSAVKQII